MIWNDASRTHAGAKRAVWDEDDYAAGVDHCLRMLAPLAEWTRRWPWPGTVVDVGCGIGRLTLPLARRLPRHKFIGLDTSPGMLAWAAQATDVSNVRWERGDVRRLLTLDQSEHHWMDGFFSVVTLQHLPEIEQYAYLLALALLLSDDGAGRFQVVVDAEQGPLSHPVDPGMVRAIFQSADCAVDDEPDPLFPTWRWFTVRR